MGHKGSKARPVSIDDIPANLDWAVSEAGIHEARLLDEKELLQADITKSQSEDNERKLTSTWQKHRSNLYTKYIFVRDSLETLITAAVAAGRVRGHIRYLDRVIGLEDVASRKTLLEDRRAKYVQQCQMMCTDWDKSYYAVEWLIRDYDLAIRYRWLDNAINGVSAGGVPAPVAEGKVAPTSAANNVNFADRDKFIKKRDKLVKEMQIHENEALDIGLNFLDTRHQGGVEARDLPDMDPELWLALDNRKKGKITPKELHNGMQSTMKERDRSYDDVVNKYNYYNEIKGKLDAHNREYALTNTDAKVIQKRDSYQNDLNAAEADYRNSVRVYEEKKSLVDRLYQYFMTAFIKNALTPLDRPQSEMADDIQTTFQKLKMEQQRVDQLPATVSH